MWLINWAIDFFFSPSSFLHCSFTFPANGRITGHRAALPVLIEWSSWAVFRFIRLLSLYLPNLIVFFSSQFCFPILSCSSISQSVLRMLPSVAIPRNYWIFNRQFLRKIRPFSSFKCRNLLGFFMRISFLLWSYLVFQFISFFLWSYC